MNPKEIEKVEDSLNDILEALNVRAEVIQEGAVFVLRTDTLYGYDSEYEFEIEPLTETAKSIRDYAAGYDWQEEKGWWKPGQNGAPEEPQLTAEFRNIGGLMADIELAMDALLESTAISANEDRDRILDKYKKRLSENHINSVKEDLDDFLTMIRGRGFTNQEIIELVTERLGGLNGRNRNGVTKGLAHRDPGPPRRHGWR